MSDIIDVMTAASYSYEGSEESIEKNAIAMMQHYGETRSYLCNDNDCIVPETKKHVIAYLQQARALMQSTTTIEHEAITDKAPQTQVTSCAVETEKKTPDVYSVVMCAFAGMKGQSPSLHDMNNLIRQEVMWYSLFAEYYAYYLETTPLLQPTRNTTDPDSFLQAGQAQADALRDHARKAQQASSRSIQQIAQIYESFPLHIGLLAYYEVIREVRLSLSRVYTPIHQLYFKLQNVQAQG
jgi:hypothetical protein